MFSFNRQAEAPREAGPSLRDVGATTYYLTEEVRAAREAVTQLDMAVSCADSFREKSSRLLEEAHRALSRLQQAISIREAPELIVVACEIKVSARRGITLVQVHGHQNGIGKLAAVMARRYIYTKFDKVADHLASLIPPPDSVTSSGAMMGMDRHRSSVNTGCPLLGHHNNHSGSAAPAHHPPTGVVLRNAKHDKVFALAYVPEGCRTVDSSTPHICIWWSAGQVLEFYSEATQSTTCFAIDKSSLTVTAIAIDSDGNVWTGHIKGLVRVRQKTQWEDVAEDKCFNSAVRTICFDGSGAAWVGDDEGRIKALRYDDLHARVELLATLQRTPSAFTRSVHGVRHFADTTRGVWSSMFGSSSSAPSMAAGALPAARSSSIGQVPAIFESVGDGGSSSSAGPIALRNGGSSAFESAGFGLSSSSAGLPAIRSGSSGSVQSLQHAATVPNMQMHVDGPVRSMLVRDGRAFIAGGKCSSWLTLWNANTFEDMDTWNCAPFGHIHAMVAVSWLGNSAMRRVSTASANNLAATPSTLIPAVAEGAAPPIGFFGLAGPWRLLTGHDNGQILMWHPEHSKLAPLLRINEPGSPVRGIAVFDAPALIVSAHANGELHMFVAPHTETAPGADSAHVNSFATLRPRKVKVQAHRSDIHAMVSNPTSLVTASEVGTVRMWYLADLAAEATHQGLLPAPLSASDKLLSNARRISASSSNDLLSTPSLVESVLGGNSRRGRSFTESANLGTQTPPRTSAQGGGTAVQRQPPPLSNGNGNNRTGRSPSGSAGDSGAATLLLTGSEIGVPSTPGTLTTTNTSPLTPGTQTGSSTAFGGFTSATQTIDSSELTLKKLIGSGAYGKVWLADWTNCAVAVKELLTLRGAGDLAGPAGKEYEALINEVHLLGSLMHPNIVRFLAMCLDPPMIVMQYYPHGSLYDLLQRARAGQVKAIKDLTWSKRLDMLKDVAAGMQYLHSRKPPVIHGDLRSPNLLLDLTIERERPRYHLKIADFGLARMLGATSNAVAVSKTTNPRWSAPEVIRHSMIGKAADVYSFAVVMWEVLTWQAPYDDMMSVQVIFSTVAENARPSVPTDLTKLPGKPGASLPQYLELMRECWAADAADRPAFKDLVDRFQAMRDVESKAARSAAHGDRASPSAPPPPVATAQPTVVISPAQADLLGDFITLENNCSSNAPPTAIHPVTGLPVSDSTRQGSNATDSASSAAALESALKAVASQDNSKALIIAQQGATQLGKPSSQLLPVDPFPDIFADYSYIVNPAPVTVHADSPSMLLAAPPSPHRWQQPQPAAAPQEDVHSAQHAQHAHAVPFPAVSGQDQRTVAQQSAASKEQMQAERQMAVMAAQQRAAAPRPPMMEAAAARKPPVATYRSPFESDWFSDTALGFSASAMPVLPSSIGGHTGAAAMQQQPQQQSRTAATGAPAAVAQQSAAAAAPHHQRHPSPALECSLPQADGSSLKVFDDGSALRVYGHAVTSGEHAGSPSASIAKPPNTTGCASPPRTAAAAAAPPVRTKPKALISPFGGGFDFDIPIPTPVRLEPAATIDPAVEALHQRKASSVFPAPGSPRQIPRPPTAPSCPNQPDAVPQPNAGVGSSSSNSHAPASPSRSSQSQQQQPQVTQQQEQAKQQQQQAARPLPPLPAWGAINPSGVTPATAATATLDPIVAAQRVHSAAAAVNPSAVIPLAGALADLSRPRPSGSFGGSAGGGGSSSNGGDGSFTVPKPLVARRPAPPPPSPEAVAAAIAARSAAQRNGVVGVNGSVTTGSANGATLGGGPSPSSSSKDASLTAAAARLAVTAAGPVQQKARSEVQLTSQHASGLGQPQPPLHLLEDEIEHLSP